MKKNDLKILSLQHWMYNPTDLDETCLTAIMPILKRNGYYLTKEMCWFEIDNRAYKYNKEYFEYNLSLLNHRRLRETEFKAIKYLISNKLASKELKEKYHTEIELRDLRKLQINSTLWKVKK